MSPGQKGRRETDIPQAKEGVRRLLPLPFLTPPRGSF